MQGYGQVAYASLWICSACALKPWALFWWVAWRKKRSADDGSGDDESIGKGKGTLRSWMLRGECSLCVTGGSKAFIVQCQSNVEGLVVKTARRSTAGHSIDSKTPMITGVPPDLADQQLRR